VAKSLSNLERFIQRVYRRLVVLRVLEGGGVGLLVAGTAAIILFSVKIYRGEAVGAAAGVMALLGGLAGIGWAIWRRPRPIDAALEADRQLQMAELLSTAWVMRIQVYYDKELMAAVLAMADARCGSRDASSVVLGRLGRRAWGSIGLVCALSVVLGLMSVNPIQSRALAGAAMAGAVANGPDKQPAGAQAFRAAGLRSEPSGAMAVDHPGGDEGGFNPSRNTSSAIEATGQAGRNTETGNAEGPGAGTGRSQSTGRIEPMVAAGSNSEPAGQEGVASAGTGATAERATTGNGPAGAMAGSASKPRVTPVWAAAGWAAAREQAGAAVRSGRVPAEHQDIVSKYFDRD
jgi:hypothetical protein